MQVRRLPRVFGVFGLAALLTITVMQAPVPRRGTPTPAVALAAAAVSTTHPYSDPVWFPLHVPVRVGCIGDHVNNNGPSTGTNNCAGDHRGYFAMNFNITDPANPHPYVYAAGAGIVIQATRASSACVPTGGRTGGGSEVVIDHGGGIVSVYQHLYSVSVRVGSAVAPRTAIGRAGSTGAPCQRTVKSYLDFQVHRNGGQYLTATSTAINTLRGCAGGSAVNWPAALGRSVYAQAMGSPLPARWVDVPYLTLLNTPSGRSCLPAGTPATPGRMAAPRTSRATTSAGLAWTPVRGANRYEAQIEIWRPSTHSWDAPCSPYITSSCSVGYYPIAGSASRYTLRGLLAGRSYRVRLSAHTAAGWSIASSWRSLIPRPSAPVYHRLRGYAHHVVLIWTAPSLHGTKLSGYQVAISRKTRSGWTRWSYTTTGRTPSHTWTHTRAGARYRVTVRARTNTGVYGPWMARHYRTTARH
ncbi:peptidoglycan DD-metalloendopeptidase family protein [Jatrophihabitans cynanchi]|uniref:Peptidoglycan DD-metalloendopeptidase family protein n=1 Tax=Jatrophihabitans cynanchi TaxID=2944128 RepID=A0ABY7K0F1_9ACTN|nr:peptidoglycan DD-metalloendopeptidase family protein [Jatrophihabitans sp. SB3-54]WAX57067.1 peptidoglycan DD-metalloendopeptidase family protein [Jatrophihabitans sp. SB3-54]